jgi:cytochrome c oxidase assembly protein Cox11
MQQPGNRKLVLSLAGVAIGMLMLAYASVPLYRLFVK